MTILDIAQSMKGRLRDGYSTQQSGVTADGGAVEYGTAIGDSSGGYVTVVMDGSPDQSATYQFEVEVDAPVTDGDRIAYVRQGGQAKAIALETLSQVAEDAESIATATNQHFWADTNGVHVSTDEDDPAGTRNILINSLGILLRKAANTLVSISETAVAFFDGNGDQTASFGTSGAQIGKASEQNIAIDPNIGITFNKNGVQLADIHQVSNGGGITLGANSLITGRDVSTSSTMSLGVNGASQAALNLEAVTGANTAGVYLNASAETVTIDGTLSLTSPLAIASGGSGQTGTSTDTTVANIITAGTGITITEAHYCTWGKVAMLMVGLKRSTAISAGGAITIGSVKSGHRPVTDAAGGSNTLNGWLSTGGNFTARNISGSQISANTAIYISLTYLLP